MTTKMNIAIAGMALLMATMACTLIGDDIFSEADFPENLAPQEATEELLSCPLITDRIIALAASEGGNAEENLLDTELTLVTYGISGNALTDPYYEDVSSEYQDYQGDEQTHQRIWDYFQSLIPPEGRRSLGEYAIITDGQGGTLAAVSQTQFDPAIWSLQVDIADIGNYDELTYTLVHEFGHLLTLGPGQVPPNLAVFNNPDDETLYFKESSACPNYFPGEGCANANSYVNAFYEQFWADIYEEWNAINLEEDSDYYYELLDDFYYKYEDQFVTSYAPTNVEEDISEAFAFFIFSSEPAGDSIAEEKILFFYQYPELMALRARIISNTCLSFSE